MKIDNWCPPEVVWFLRIVLILIPLAILGTITVLNWLF